MWKVLSSCVEDCHPGMKILGSEDQIHFWSAQPALQHTPAIQTAVDDSPHTPWYWRRSLSISRMTNCYRFTNGNNTKMFATNYTYRSARFVSHYSSRSLLTTRSRLRRSCSTCARTTTLLLPNEHSRHNFVVGTSLRSKTPRIATSALYPE